MEARGHDRPADRSLNSEINVTPLVDVMLVVLIIFMVVTPLLQVGVGVDLPASRHVAETLATPDYALTVVLQDRDRMLLGTEPIDPAALAGALRRRYQADPGLQLQIKADRNVPYGAIKRVLQAGRAAGFHGAALIARQTGLPQTSGNLTGSRERMSAASSPRRGG